MDIDALLGAEYDGNANPIGNEVPLEANVDTSYADPSPSFAATGQNQNRNLQMEPAVMEVDEFGIPRSWWYFEWKIMEQKKEYFITSFIFNNLKCIQYCNLMKL